MAAYGCMRCNAEWGGNGLWVKAEESAVRVFCLWCTGLWPCECAMPLSVQRPVSVQHPVSKNGGGSGLLVYQHVRRVDDGCESLLWLRESTEDESEHWRDSAARDYARLDRLLSGHAVSTIGFNLAVGLLVFPSIKRTSPQSDWMILLKKWFLRKLILIF